MDGIGLDVFERGREVDKDLQPVVDCARSLPALAMEGACTGHQPVQRSGLNWELVAYAVVVVVRAS
jgi:hypothetical protein